MPLSTTINQPGTGVPYCMELYFDIPKDTFVLSFASMRPGINHQEERNCKTWTEAFSRFTANCRWYGIPEPAYISEEEFLGVPRGTLYPSNNKKGGRK